MRLHYSTLGMGVEYINVCRCMYPNDLPPSDIHTHTHTCSVGANGLPPRHLRRRGRAGQQATGTCVHACSRWDERTQPSKSINHTIESIHSGPPYMPQHHHSQVVGEPVDVEFFDPDNPLLLLPASGAVNHPLAGLLPPETLVPPVAAAEAGAFLFLSVFKVSVWSSRLGVGGFGTYIHTYARSFHSLSTYLSIYLSHIYVNHDCVHGSGRSAKGGTCC
jgi:hypothetical protein